MSNQVILIDILLILMGFAIVFIGALARLDSDQKDAKIAVGGFIGFIPFGFTNDKRLVWSLAALMALALAFFFALDFSPQHRFK